MCDHDWQPIPGWYARYRCSICQVIGCKFGVVVGPYREHPRSVQIAPYRCESRCGGVKCNEPAVHASYGKKFRCAAHRHPGHATRARKELAATKVTEAPVISPTEEPIELP
jgi:hypothetical protein